MSASNSQTVVLPVTPTREMLIALMGNPLMLAASDEIVGREAYAAMIAAAPKSSGPSEPARLDLTRYVNAASIGGGDAPHEVVEKLQKAINNSAPIQAHSKSEYKRLDAQGANVVPPQQSAGDERDK